MAQAAPPGPAPSDDPTATGGARATGPRARADAPEIALVLAGRDGTVHYANAATRRHFGFSPATGAAAPRLWQWFSGPDGETLRRLVAAPATGPSAWLELLPRGGRAVVRCQLALSSQGLLLLADSGPASVRAAARDGTGRSGRGDTQAHWQGLQYRALADALEALQGRNAELERNNARLQALAHTDALTGLFNRHHFEEALQSEIDRVRRNQSALCAVMVDLDRFKTVNDRFGHDAGDRALVGVAQALRAGSRPYDVVARYGGEEFVLLLPDTDLRAGAECAERLRHAIARESDRSVVPLTASLGVAALAQDEDRASLLRRADAALYRAKRRGRNRVECDRTVGVA